MRVAADATDRVARHAQRFAGTAVTTRARRRIAACFAAVPVIGGCEPDPACRVRVAAALASDAACYVATRAPIDRMARGARSGIRARFEAVARCETCPVCARAQRIRDMNRRG